MLQRVFAAADIERVAVGDEGLTAAFLDEVGDDLGIVRAQKRQVAELAEVQLDGDEFAVKSIWENSDCSSSFRSLSSWLTPMRQRKSVK